MKIGEMEIYPSKIICVGTNYMDHIEETKLEIPKEPVLFPKTLNCLITENQSIIYPKMLYENRKMNRVDYEVELAFVISKTCKNVNAQNA
ncbi:MAG: fumarylacetoacetate hydrolase family protein, partial [Candidatus Lokiarchaeota archaeon]|nr:fumarylacetoacetate hydrolase family protein [Candidatus Lokiarchaeota archaeon]